MMRIEALVKDVPLPRIVKVRQKFPATPPLDVEKAVERELSRPEIAARVKKGQRIAVGVGSRGVASIDRMVRGVVRKLKDLGAEPFIVPAMGSHGGATDAGQANVLAHLGITEATVGAPVRSSMETVTLSRSPSGVTVYFDKTAYEADAIVPINRVKLHTAFRGPVESGLLKMLAIGFGKHKGADSIHALGFDRFGTLIPEIGRHILDRTRVIFGVASVENSREQPAIIKAVPAERFEEEEQTLLEESKRLMARILFPKLDVLVVGELGKNISGDGMDPNVTGRYLSYLGTAEPYVQKIAVLDLTDETYGNALGIGMADVTTRRAADKIDFYPMYVNALTSRILTGARVPLTVETDRDAVALALASCFGVEPGKQRAMFIQNTLKLEQVYISEALLEQARSMDSVEVLSEPFALPFASDGTLNLDFE